VETVFLVLAVAIWLTVYKIREEPVVPAAVAGVPLTYGACRCWCSTASDVRDFRVQPGTVAVKVKRAGGSHGGFTGEPDSSGRGSDGHRSGAESQAARGNFHATRRDIGECGTAEVSVVFPSQTDRKK